MQPKPYKYTEWNNCPVCGSELVIREDELDGQVPHCPNCHSDRFPLYNVACSMIILDPSKEKTLLVKQYEKNYYRFVAGYVNKGEDAEETVVREIREELGVGVLEMSFNRSHFFPPTNALMLNYTVVADSMELHPNIEIDEWTWFTMDEAMEALRPNALVTDFLKGYLTGEYNFQDYTK